MSVNSYNVFIFQEKNSKRPSSFSTFQFVIQIIVLKMMSINIYQKQIKKRWVLNNMFADKIDVCWWNV